MLISQKPAVSARLSGKAQAVCASAAVVIAVALPQLFHALGSLLHLGTALGEIFLPMHLPVILAGLLAGPLAGAAAGLLSPLLSFLVSGMPGQAMLPFMLLELGSYGLIAGLVRRTGWPSVLQVLIVQIGGRILRAGGILLAFYGLHSTAVAPAVILQSLKTGAVGILLQLLLIPLLLRVAAVRNDRGSH